MKNVMDSDLNWFKSVLKNKKIIDLLKNIKLIISDVDGSLTDAKVYVDEEGEGGREFSTQDGYIVRPCLERGLVISLISGKANVSTQIRAKYIGIPENLCFTGNVDKLDLVKNLMSKYNIGPDQVLVYGDDMPDLRIRLNGLAGIFVSPSNAPFYVMHEADFVVPRSGGNNAFRLLMDLILYVQGGHEAADLIEKSLSE